MKEITKAKKQATANKKKEVKKQKPADLHKFAFNILVYSDATAQEIKDIDSGIWKQKHKVKY